MRPDLTKKDVNIEKIAKFALKHKEFLEELIGNLKSKQETIRHNSSKVLNLISKQKP